MVKAGTGQRMVASQPRRLWFKGAYEESRQGALTVFRVHCFTCKPLAVEDVH